MPYGRDREKDITVRIGAVNWRSFFIILLNFKASNAGFLSTIAFILETSLGPKIPTRLRMSSASDSLNWPVAWHRGISVVRINKSGKWYYPNVSREFVYGGGNNIADQHMDCLFWTINRIYIQPEFSCILTLASCSVPPVAGNAASAALRLSYEKFKV